MEEIYEPQTWVNESLAGEERYDILEDNDTPVHENIQIRLRTNVAVAGTPVDADRMNHIENGLEDLDSRVVDIVGSIFHTSGNSMAEVQCEDNVVLTDASKPIQVLDPNGGDRTLTFPAVSANNHAFAIFHNGTGHAFTCDDIDNTPISTGKAMLFFPSPDGYKLFAGGGGTTVEEVLAFL